MLDQVADSAPKDSPDADLGPLAWVFEELRKSLDAANKAIRRFLRDHEQARKGDLEAADPGSLRLARQQIHQAVGALELVGLSAPAQVLRGMEAAVQRFVQRPDTCTAEAAVCVERAGFALVEYLDGVLRGKQLPPVALFAQYREVQELAGAERIHPADLWSADHRNTDLPAPEGVTVQQPTPALRSLFDRLVLLVVKTHSPASLQSLARLCAGLSAGAAHPRQRTFWRVAAAFFEAQAAGLIPVDVYVKRATSRVLLQFTSLQQGKAQVSETLLHDLLFFCAQAAQATAERSPQLQGVREACGLQGQTPVNYQQASLGRYDPAVLAQARKRIHAAKETWSLFAGGDASRARQATEQIGLIADSLLKLHPTSTALAASLVRAAEQAAGSPSGVRPELAMEVATVTLYLEAVFDDFDPAATELTERSQALARRLDGAMAGAPSQPLDLWMEQLYSRVSDRQTMGSVVGELKVSLGEAEKALDQFFRDPQEKAGLHVAASQLAQMRGVLSVLGLDQAVHAVARMRTSVEQMIDTEVDEVQARAAGTFQLLGNNLSALSFLVDMLNYQPTLARKLFVFDDEAGELKPVMGRVGSPDPMDAPLAQDALELSQGVQQVVEGVQDGTPLVDITRALDQLAEQASLADQPAVARAAREAADAVVANDPDAGAQALVDLSASAPVSRPAEAAPAAADDSGDDDDLLGIFLEEAREVVVNGREAVAQLRDHGRDLEQLTTLRRAFHTLKGSSRMVGLTDFGEAAWSMEQLLNATLAEQRGAGPDLLDLSASALDAFGQWADDIAAGRPPAWTVAAFRRSAEALRDQTGPVPLEPSPVAEPAMVAVPEVAPEVVPEVEVIDLADLPMPELLPDPVPMPELSDIDLGSLEAFADAPGSVSAAEPAPAADLPPVQDAVETQAPVNEPDSIFASYEDAEFLEPDEADAPQELQEPQAAVQAEVQAEPASDAVDEQVRVIGSLRIGLKLFNVYLNEADEWSRRLGTVLSEWAMETHEPVPEAAEALAHSLAGSSATVGFDALSQVARALEHALGMVAAHQNDGFVASASLASLFVEASEDIRRLLHQFAAGFLKEPDEALLTALREAASQAHLQAPVDAGDPDAAIEVIEEVDLPDTADMADMVEPVPASVPRPAPRRAAHAVQDIDDDIDAVDTIDVDLFPIFTEEAEELLPQLAGALRQWSARPDNASARAEVLRNLHTLKGSARLAGALRLGEMAHRMETAAERLGSDVQRSADIEPLQSAFDAIVQRFDQLRNPEAAQDVLQTAPEGEAAAPAEPADTDMVEAPAAPAAAAVPAMVNASAGLIGLTTPQAPVALAARSQSAVRVRPELLDRLVNQAGEVLITRSRMESELVTLRASLKDLTGNLDRLRQQLRDIELQAESQMQSRLAQARDADQSFDPLEFDRFTRVQELTRMMAESVNDVATVQRNLQRAVESTEDSLVAQARQTRELQRDLLRTRMVEFEGISERLYRVVRQASKETGKQVRLDITGGNIEMDRGVLDRMTASFEHLLRNCVVHGIESPEVRAARGKPAEGQIEITLSQELNDVSVVFSDDGNGLDLDRLREKGLGAGLIDDTVPADDPRVAQLVFEPGISTAQTVSELAGRGIGMDVVRNDVVGLGGRVETASRSGEGTRFTLVLPLTTAVTQVVMLRAGELTVGVPSSLVELVRRVSAAELDAAYASGQMAFGGESIPFFWSGALLQSSAASQESQGRTLPVVIFRSAAQRVAVHVDEVLGSQEVVVKNLGAQLSRLPGLAGMSVLASGAVVLIYNPVALSTVYGVQVRSWVTSRQAASAAGALGGAERPEAVVSSVPLVLVVDDSITVRRVTQRLLQREGYRVALAADGLQALERLQAERPAVVLSDIEMPRMDGFDLVRNIRNDAALKGLPVIMITSRIAEKHREHARELGVDHYLGKPYAEDDLLALVARYAHAPAEAG
nr:Hpt domain-containing protein [uncultured Hydrogenophaga sp.]